MTEQIVLNIAMNQLELLLITIFNSIVMLTPYIAISLVVIVLVCILISKTLNKKIK